MFSKSVSHNHRKSLCGPTKNCEHLRSALENIPHRSLQEKCDTSLHYTKVIVISSMNSISTPSFQNVKDFNSLLSPTHGVLTG
jgi:hypothetical protein